ncbi:hypothetical protein O181_022218 [Austropuccinia psidii MF-1]|uniref:Uncharacterized protein n=1 Tax=Austropuccinia psidii MF-1 TaxID=1389203 RepID=A0A9Q3CGE5_9BASI|nr:hypothetical protein [Austropuccinia psidii MF-1]
MQVISIPDGVWRGLFGVNDGSCVLLDQNIVCHRQHKESGSSGSIVRAIGQEVPRLQKQVIRGTQCVDSNIPERVVGTKTGNGSHQELGTEERGR